MMIGVGVMLCAGCLVISNRADAIHETRWTRAGFAALVLGVVGEVLL